MMQSLRLENFKPFEQQLLFLQNLTLLSGLNGTGKSSVLQALLVLRQSYQQDLLPDIGLALNGDLTSIGIAQDALFEAAKEDSIAFEISWDRGKQGFWRFQYDRQSDVLALASPTLNSEVYQSNLFNDNFYYIQAERLGPRTYLEISEYEVRQHRRLGTKGEHTGYFLALYRDRELPNPQLQHPSSDSLNLKIQVEAWLGEVSPGTRLNIVENSTLDLVSLKYSYGLSNQYRATNVGFGISYTLPIIVAILASPPGTLILLENPEAHLHPQGQAKMGELLALAANCGVQIIVETHSDHILNGIRLAVYSGKVKSENVQLHYFQRRDNKGEMRTEVISPKIDGNGRIDKWPDGFFDEWDKSLEALLEPRGE